MRPQMSNHIKEKTLSLKLFMMFYKIHLILAICVSDKVFFSLQLPENSVSTLGVHLKAPLNFTPDQSIISHSDNCK